MAMSIMTNVASLAAQRNLGQTERMLNQSIGRLSSGLRINRAGDDAAGLGISENLKADIRSLAQARRNANDAVSLTQVAEGALNEIHGIVSQLRQRAVQAANGTIGAAERGYIHTEFLALRAEIDRIASVTEFNGQLLLDGSAATGLNFQVGIHSTANDRLSMSVATVVASTLGSTGGGLTLGSASLSTVTNALQALASMDFAIQQLSTRRASIGALQNRIQVTIANLSVAHENLSAANSRIRDTDVAEETARLTRSQILVQAGVSVLSQANQIPTAALSLIGQ